MKSVFFPRGIMNLPNNLPNGLVPGGEHLGNPMGNTFSMDTTWEHR